MIGVDEVGRGCLAGPLLVVAARSKGDLPQGLKDSKLLTKKQRQKILNKLNNICEFGEGWVGVEEINNVGLAESLRLGVARALKSLGVRISEEIIIDGSVNYCPKEYKLAQAIVKADNFVPIVSAASIYAKVTRDNYMVALAQKHPKYSFDKHVGYGTALHLAAIKEYGPIKLVHRINFAPISEVAK